MLGRSSPSYAVRGYSLPRAGTFSGRSRSLLARAFARNSVLRQMDWILVIVVAGKNASSLAPVVYGAGAAMVANPDPARGQFSSLQVGLQEVLNRGRDAAMR